MRSTQPGSSKKTCAHRPPRGSSLCRHVRACLHALGAAIGKRGSELRGTGAARRGRTAPASDASIFSVVLCSRSQHLTTFSHQPGLSSRACTRLCVRVSLRARVSVCARVCARAHVGRGEPTAALFVSARARVGVRARVCARACRPGGAHRGTVARQRQLEQLRVRRKPREHTVLPPARLVEPRLRASMRARVGARARVGVRARMPAGGSPPRHCCPSAPA